MNRTVKVMWVLGLAIFQSVACAAPPPPVLTGLDVLENQGFAPLAGRRVGVITNQTGVDSRGTPLLSLLRAHPEVKLRAVFAPEHGLQGRLDSEYGFSRVSGDSLPLYSLYGQDRKPRPEWLDSLDILVFDIQDIGTRFYTYITTLALAMQAAAEAGVEVMVLDRPDPIGGLAVEGPVLEKSLCGNFIAYYPIPVRHGLTVGELAGMFNAEFGIGARLSVIKMQGWRRGMYYDSTGLAWVDPSPNMKSLQAAILYPGLGIAEATNISVGRGTDIPFELYGAPWVDGAGLAAGLDSAGLVGVEFRDTTFTPTAYVFKGEACHGVRAHVTDRQAFRSVEAGLALLIQLQRMYPGKFDLASIDRWIGRKDVQTQIRKGGSAGRIVAGWQPSLGEFLQTRARYLLYAP